MADNLLSSIEAFSNGPVPSDPAFTEEWQDKVDEFYDDISGEALPAAGVTKARMEEIKCIRKIKLYNKVPRQVAIDRGKQILPVRWVDVNKGDEQKMKLRSRIVASSSRPRPKKRFWHMNSFRQPRHGR